MRWFLTAVAVLLLIVSAVLSVLRFLDLPVSPIVQITSFASYALVGYVLALLIWLGLSVRPRGRRSRPLLGAALALAGVVLSGWLLSPLYVGKGAGTTTDLVVMTANLQYGGADANTVVRTATDRSVDLLVLEEVTPAERTALDAAGLSTLLPNTVGEANKGVAGTLVFSRLPLKELGTIPITNGGHRVQVGTGADRFTLLAVHAAYPPSVSRWHRDQRTIAAAARSAMKDGPTIVAGDFNATTDHAAFRKILGAGLSDATAQANSGWQPTWPSKYRRSWYRPLVAIDHVLTTNRYSAVRTRTVSIPGTDHLGVLVQLDRV